MIAQEKSQTRQYQLEAFEREKKELELENRLQQLTSAVAFKDKEVLEIQQELEKARKMEHASARSANAAAATHSEDGSRTQILEEATNNENERLFEFLLDDSIDSLTESQPPDEESLLSDGLVSHSGAATFRSLSKKEKLESSSYVKPLKLKSALSGSKTTNRPEETAKKSAGSKAAQKKVRIASPPAPTSPHSPGNVQRGARSAPRSGNMAASQSTIQADDSPTKHATQVSEAACRNENQRLRDALAQLKGKWRGVKRAINGDAIDRDRGDLVRETRLLRAHLRDILREELAAFGQTFLAPSAPLVLSPSPNKEQYETTDNCNHHRMKRRRQEKLDPTEEATTASDTEKNRAQRDRVVPQDQTGVEHLAVDELPVRDEIRREVRAELEMEMALQFEKERTKAKSLEEEMKKVKRKTKIVYERYGILKKKKLETEDQLRKSEKEKDELKKANTTFVERNEALAARVREVQELTQAAEKCREELKLMKKQNKELAYFKERQVQRTELLQSEHDEARRSLADLERKYHEVVNERDTLVQRTDLLERHNHELLARSDRSAGEIEGLQAKLSRKKAAIARLQQELAHHDTGTSEDPLASGKRKRPTGERECEDTTPTHKKAHNASPPTRKQEEEEGQARAKQGTTDHAEEDDDGLQGSPPITLTGFTCLTAASQGEVDGTPGFPLSIPLLDSQESEDLFGGKDDHEERQHEEAPEANHSSPAGQEKEEENVTA